jgi:hypothetical protein
MRFYIAILGDDDFGIPSHSHWMTQQAHVNQNVSVRGIKQMNGPEAIVDPACISWTSWWKPVEKILSLGKRIQDISDEEFKESIKVFGRYEEDCRVLKFESNPYDIDLCKKDEDRILFRYESAPIRSFYCIQEEDAIRINITPFTKSYFTIQEYEWLKFLEFLDSDRKEMRDAKLNCIFDENSEGIDIVRQAKFMLNSGEIGHRSRDFVSSVLAYYDKNGKITERQAEALKNAIKK